MARTSVARAPGGRAAGAERRARKNMDIDVGKLQEARRILGTRTDTETVDQALDLVIFQGEVFSALDRLAAAGGIDDIYAAPERAPAPARHRRGRRTPDRASN